MNMMRAIRARKALDVGFFTGFSAVGAALALNDVGRKYAQEVANSYCNLNTLIFLDC
jgi:predicted O-methyltransferase YrrM